MENNERPTISLHIDDENHVGNESSRHNSNSMGSKLSDDNSKRHKGSFLSQLRKRLSFHKKAKSKDSNNDNNIIIGHKESTASAPIHSSKSDKNNVGEIAKQENRLSAIRRSFGKGKSKESLSTKDSVYPDLTKIKETMNQNQTRPQSMHIANSHPPRNWVLASFGWYWGPLSRSEATHRLRHQDDGSFLVRDSEGDPNKFTLSFKGAGQIFHNRILQNQSKYAFLPDEEFDSIPDLITDAMRRSATSAYCFSRSTDVASATLAAGASETHNPLDGAVNGNCSVGTVGTHHKHEVRLLKSISRFADSPRSLFYLCRFMIRQYTRFQDLCTLVSNPEIATYLEDHKYNL